MKQEIEWRIAEDRSKSVVRYFLTNTQTGAVACGPRGGTRFWDHQTAAWAAAAHLNGKRQGAPKKPPARPSVQWFEPKFKAKARAQAEEDFDLIDDGDAP